MVELRQFPHHSLQPRVRFELTYPLISYCETAKRFRLQPRVAVSDWAGGRNRFAVEMRSLTDAALGRNRFAIEEFVDNPVEG